MIKIGFKDLYLLNITKVIYKNNVLYDRNARKKSYFFLNIIVGE